jgi:hypothetical protein
VDPQQGSPRGDETTGLVAARARFTARGQTINRFQVADHALVKQPSQYLIHTEYPPPPGQLPVSPTVR